MYFSRSLAIYIPNFVEIQPFQREKVTNKQSRGSIPKKRPRGFYQNCVVQINKYSRPFYDSKSLDLESVWTVTCDISIFSA